jgi:peptide/nickel transport system substrate-binding protein
VLSDAGIGNLSLTLRYQPVFPEQAQEATLLQSNLAQIGVAIKLEPIAFADYLSTLSAWKKIPELMLAQESLPFPDPGSMLTQGYRSTSMGTNKAAYANPKVDGMIAQALSTADSTSRCAVYQQAEKTLDDEDAAMPLYTITTPFAYRKGVTGVEASPASGADVSLYDLRQNK